MIVYRLIMKGGAGQLLINASSQDMGATQALSVMEIMSKGMRGDEIIT